MTAGQRKRKRQLYKALRNYVANELGLTAEQVQRYIQTTLRSIVDDEIHRLFETNNIRQIMGDAVAFNMKSKRYERGEWTDMNSFINGIIRDYVVDYLKRNVQFSVNVQQVPLQLAR